MFTYSPLFIFVTTIFFIFFPVLSSSIGDSYDVLKEVGGSDMLALPEGIYAKPEPTTTDEEREKEQSRKPATSELSSVIDSLKNIYREAALDGLWPLGIIPFTIDHNVFDEILEKRVQDAMDVLHTASCLKFYRFTPEKIDTSDMMWLNITNPGRERECSHKSTIQKSGEVTVVLGLDCLDRHEILHTLMHAVGFGDEVAHPQRDKYISINWNNLQPQYEPLFATSGVSEDSRFEYDPLSIMHFHDRAFSKNGGPTIVSLVPGLMIQPSNDLSRLDRMKLRLMFNRECNRRTVEKLYDTCKQSMR